MLTIRKLTKSFGGRILFEDAQMQVNYSERVALVGPNGAGKSTLFNIILNTEDPDKGKVGRDAWTTIGYLPQESEAIGDETVLEVATGRAGEGSRSTHRSVTSSSRASRCSRLIIPVATSRPARGAPPPKP